MRILVWLFRALIFFTLFAFALNNLQPADVHWFFGVEWRAPMVIVVLVAFAAGCALGVLAMVPGWWRHRQAARRNGAPLSPGAVTKAPQRSTAPADSAGDTPPRQAL